MNKNYREAKCIWNTFYDGTALAEGGASAVYRKAVHTASLSLPMALSATVAVNRALHTP